MTRNSEINCEDLFGCDHEPETSISDGGEIIGWRCRCGRRVPEVRSISECVYKGRRRDRHEMYRIKGKTICKHCGYEPLEVK